MSAPTAFDGGAFVSGLAWHVRTPVPGSGVRGATEFAADRRSSAAIARLTREHDELCTQAVDPFEIAAGLEAAGVGDRQARLRYGAASVFELAAEMYRIVPRRPSDDGAPADVWHRPLRRHILRGLLYGLPGLLYAVALGAFHTGFGALVLLTATITACALGQGLSALGHVLLGRGDTAAARKLFRLTLLAGAAGFVLLSGLGLLLSPGLLPATVLAGAQIVYLLAATVLMACDEDLLLLAILSPALLLAGAELTGVARSLPRGALLGLLALTVAAAVATAASRLADGGPRVRVRLREGIGRVELRLAASFVAYGAANAGLLSFAVVDVLSNRAGTGAGSIVAMMVPIVASLGIAEWLVYRLRSRAVAALQATTSAAPFRIRARRELGQAAGGYALILTALTAAVVAWYTAQHDATALFVLGAGAYAVLGVALLLQTLLLSLGRHHVALGFAAAALAADTVGRWVTGSGSGTALGLWHLAVFTAFLLCLLPVTARLFGGAGVHR